ncbi:MAG: hypothetical protein Q9175_003793 [Cornicularia normoerica]
MKGDRGLGELGRRQRGPNLPDRTRDQESFRQNIPRPSGSAETFARHHAELYADEEGLVDDQHIGNPHFPRVWRTNRYIGEARTEPMRSMDKFEVTMLIIEDIDPRYTILSPIPGAGDMASRHQIVTVTGCTRHPKRMTVGMAKDMAIADRKKPLEGSREDRYRRPSYELMHLALFATLD